MADAGCLSIVSIATLVENKVHLFIDRMENIYPGVNPWHSIFQTDLLGNEHHARKLFQKMKLT